MHTLQVFLCCGLGTKYESLDLIELGIDMSSELAVPVGGGGGIVLHICCCSLEEGGTGSVL